MSGSSSRIAATMAARTLQRPNVPPPQNREEAIAAKDMPVAEDAVSGALCTAEATTFETALASRPDATDDTVAVTALASMPDTTAETTDVTALVAAGSQAIDMASGTPSMAAERTCSCSGEQSD